MRFFSLLILSILTFNASADPIAAVESRMLPIWWIDGKKPEPATLDSRMTYHNTPAISVAVIKDGELAWAKAWGKASEEADRDATTETLFQAASISKPVAAMAALDLAEEGLIDLDGDVNEYLKRWQIPANEFTEDEKVTVRRILNHTAGLTVWGFPGYDPNGEIATSIEVLEGKGNTDPVKVYREPGLDWQYSGGGYTVMQVLVEDVADSDFADVMEQRVLEPLGMTRSTYEQPLPDSLREIAATGYRRSGVPVAGTAHVYPEQAAAGLWTTPSELAKYLLGVRAMAAGEPGVLAAETTAMMLEPGKNDHGLGPGISFADDGKRFGHGGSNEGFKCNMFLSLDGGYGAVVMTNADPGFTLGREVMHALASYYDWPGFEPDIKAVLERSYEDLVRYEGTYRFEGYGDVFVKAGDGRLIVTSTVDEEVEHYVSETENGFFDEKDREAIEFEITDGKATAILAGGGRFRGPRVDN